jgi:hypothetical protein
MTRRDQQTGDQADGQVSLVIHPTASAGLIRFARAPAAAGANGFVLTPTRFRGSRIGFVRTARWGAVWGWLPANLRNPEPTTSTARPAP